MEFLYSNPYSSIEIADARVPAMDSHWEPTHFEQGFCIRPDAVAISTDSDEDYRVSIIQGRPSAANLAGAIFAVQLPFESSALKLKAQGANCVVDIDVDRSIRDVTFVEYANARLSIFLNSNNDGDSAQVVLLKANPLFSRTEDFKLDAKGMDEIVVR